MKHVTSLLWMALGALIVASGCAPGESAEDALVQGEDGGPPAQVADFSLEDVNATSTSFQSQISPRDYIGRISVWYFGHAT